MMLQMTNTKDDDVNIVENEKIEVASEILKVM